MAMAPIEDHLLDLLVKWDELHRQGRDVSPEELCIECPELVEELRRRIETFRKIGEVLATGPIESLSTPGDAQSDGLGICRLPDTMRASATYRPERHHARGGLGEVLTVREEELDRTVALKRIRPDKLHEAARLRFLREAAVTARLQHPGIVPIYGLGKTDDGPFYTMPFIRGRTLQEAIDGFHGDNSIRPNPTQRALKFRELLQQFIAVCNTIAYAHDQGVVHRDLKPSNIMLGPYGETLVVDWGLAKWVGANAEGIAAEEDAPSPSPSPDDLTATGSVMGTPQYMSPEQARGEPTGPASDLFSLGMILYAILTGELPNAPETFRGADAFTAVRAAAVVPPRSREPRLSRALEAICLRALEARPEDRYPSARALGDDIAKWLADEPVSAWCEPWTNRLARWVRRHSTLTATATAILVVSLVAMGIVSWLEARVARDRATANLALSVAKSEADRWLDQTMKAIEGYHTVVSEQSPALSAISPKLRDRLLEEPRRFYTRLSDELAARPVLSERELGLLGTGHTNLARILRLVAHPGAQREWEAAVAAYTKLAAAHPDVRGYRARLAEVTVDLASELKSERRMAEAAEVAQKAIAIYEELVRTYPSEEPYQYGLANARYRFATTLLNMGRPAEAVDAFHVVIDVASALVKARPDNALYRHRLAWAHSALGLALKDSGRTAEAVAEQRIAVDTHAGAVAAAPGNSLYLDGFSASHINLGTSLLADGKLQDAAEAFRRTIALYDGLGAQAAASSISTLGQVMGHEGFGEALLNSGSPAVASREFAHAIDIANAELAVRDAYAETSYWLARGHQLSGEALCAMGRPADAAKSARTAIGVYGPIVDLPGNPEFASALAVAWNTLGSALAAMGRHDEAATAYAEAVRRQRSLFDELPQMARLRPLLSGHYKGLAGVLLVLGRHQEAASAMRERAKLWLDDPAQLYDCARSLASGARLIAHETQRRATEDEAMATLLRALAAGWKDAAKVARDPALAAFHERADFQAFLAELFDRGFPTHVFARLDR